MFLIPMENMPIPCMKSDLCCSFICSFASNKTDKHFRLPMSLWFCQGTEAYCVQWSNPIMKQGCVTRLPWQNQWKQYRRDPIFISVLLGKDLTLEENVSFPEQVNTSTPWQFENEAWANSSKVYKWVKKAQVK